MRLQVISATEGHGIALASRLSEETRRDLERGWCVACPEIAIPAVIKNTPECWAVLADGDVMCVFGVNGGNVWFLNSYDFERIAFRFVRHCRKYLAQILETRDTIWNYVHEDNAKLIKWLEWCGFDIDGPVNGYRRCTLRKCASRFYRQR